MLLACAASLLLVADEPVPPSPPPPPTAKQLPYEGGLSRTDIQTVISRVMPQIKQCYEKELDSDPALEGKLTMRWVVTADGAVADALVSQNTFRGEGAKPTGDCVLGIIARLKFPQPKGGGKVFVTYPFVFSSSPQPKEPSSPFGCGALFAR
jgi:hypothetical protein